MHFAQVEGRFVVYDEFNTILTPKSCVPPNQRKYSKGICGSVNGIGG